MTNELEQLQAVADNILKLSQEPFWKHPDFWISLLVGSILGIVSIYYAKKAFVEAGEAKKAANEAGKTVKYQTVAIELTELLPKLSTPTDEIKYNEARNLLSETGQRLHRLLSPFEQADDKRIAAKIGELMKLLDDTGISLNSVRPQDVKSEADAPNAVYNAIEASFAKINNLVSDLVGLFEQRTTKFGDNHDK